MISGTYSTLIARRLLINRKLEHELFVGAGLGLLQRLLQRLHLIAHFDLRGTRLQYDGKGQE